MVFISGQRVILQTVTRRLFSLMVESELVNLISPPCLMRTSWNFGVTQNTSEIVLREGHWKYLTELLVMNTSLGGQWMPPAPRLHEAVATSGGRTAGCSARAECVHHPTPLGQRRQCWEKPGWWGMGLGSARHFRSFSGWKPKPNYQSFLGRSDSNLITSPPNDNRWCWMIINIYPISQTEADLVSMRSRERERERDIDR